MCIFKIIKQIRSRSLLKDNPINEGLNLFNDTKQTMPLLSIMVVSIVTRGPFLVHKQVFAAGNHTNLNEFMSFTYIWLVVRLKFIAKDV